ncbi:MAG: TonB-dependent receptor plug domain-containing protein [Hymenobacter sp.]
MSGLGYRRRYRGRAHHHGPLPARDAARRRHHAGRGDRDGTTARRTPHKSVESMQTISARDLTKSACCNLAESFETNAAVEVSTADAVSGAKQIQLLGLDGAYSLLTVDNQPALRGLLGPYRLGYLAGPWIGNIDIIKGTGSVVNGYEGISGQVNVQLKEPDKTDALLLNAYVNDLGKFDLNAVAPQRFNKKWSNELLLHTDHLGHRADRNRDGFLDLPAGHAVQCLRQGKIPSGHGLVAELGVGAIVENRQGGQLEFR